jgi:hypothetical protein
MTRFAIFALPLALLATTAAPAQFAGLGGAAGKNGLGSLLGGLGGGAMPSLNSVGVGNATGVLGYCVRNKLLRNQQNVAGGLLGRLTGKPAVQSSPGFLAGEQGLLQGGGKKLSLDALPDGLKAKACDLVLSKVQSFM